MNKAAVICKLHEIADHYLLGGGIWPPHWEFLPAFFKTVRELGLYEDVPDPHALLLAQVKLGFDTRGSDNFKCFRVAVAETIHFRIRV